jgi:hemolysin III
VTADLTILDPAATAPPRDVPLGSPTRPSWRGRLHLAMLAVTAPLCALVAVDATSLRSRIGLLIFAAALCSMLSVSVTYHRWVHTLTARAAWRRADHAMIFVAIAGTATPLCLELEPASSATWRLVFVWTIAAVGVAAKLSGSRRGDHVGNGLYIANGWAGVLILPPLWASGEVMATGLIILGGVVYTVGAVGFNRRWPRLRPSVFGYHEVWHAATVVAAGAHLLAVWMITT